MSDLLAVHTLSTKPVDMRFFCDMVLQSREELGEKQRLLTATHYKEKTGGEHLLINDYGIYLRPQSSRA